MQTGRNHLFLSLPLVLDAIGKPSAGMLDGAITMFGNYRQCMQVRAYEDDDELDDFFETDEPKKPVEKKEVGGHSLSLFFFLILSTFSSSALPSPPLPPSSLPCS